MIRSVLPILIIIALSLSGNVRCTTKSSVVILQREWTANAEFAGDTWAELLAPTYGINIEVREGSETIDPVKMVRTKQAHFGVASADRVLQENQGGAGLVILAVATWKSPVIFLTRKELNIRGPGDFKGHMVGLQPGTNTELVFNALAKSSGLLSSDIKVVDSGWGTQTFETGTIDILGAFAYDEAVTLTMKGFSFDVVSPEKFGVHFVGTVYFTRKQLAEKNPKLVQAFVNSLVAGWRKALEDPNAAIEILGRRFRDVRANNEKEIRSLEIGKPYFQGEQGNILYSTKNRWEAMAKHLIDLGKLKKFRLADNVDYRFLQKAW